MIAQKHENYSRISGDPARGYLRAFTPRLVADQSEFVLRLPQLHWSALFGTHPPNLAPVHINIGSIKN